MLASLAALGLANCGGSAETQEPKWPPQANMWFERALSSFRSLDAKDAERSIERALQLTPERAEARVLAGRIALARLDHAGALEHVKGLASPEARAVRGRALWYSGKVSEAADELEELLADPAVRDVWAEGVLKLARVGRGRQPFAMSGERLAVIEMPRVNSTSMVVPVELNGQPVLALVATSSAEVIVDAGSNREPNWVNLRFEERIEMRDVPALTQDLSGVSREIGAPIKVLLGTNLLRHLNVTFDYLGRQFVVRNYDPPPPPEGTKLDIHYIRGGGMVLSSQIGQQPEAPAFSLFVDTLSSYPVVLDEPAWERTKLASQRQPVANKAGVTRADLPRLRLGSFGIDDVTAVGGVDFAELEKALDIELDGLLGSGVLSAYRVTLAEGGRAMWLEGAPLASPAPAPESAPAPSVPAAPTPEQPAPSPNPAEPG